MSGVTSDDIIAWMQTHPVDTSYTLVDVAAQFNLSPERMRDRLLRLVNSGQLAQSAPVFGLADGNPSYTLTKSAQ